MEEVQTDRIVIVGAGLGALYAALTLAPLPVVMISPDPLGQGASSAWAQGGVAAAMDAGDSPEAHARDTLRAGAGTVDPKVADLVTREAREHILDLLGPGDAFDLISLLDRQPRDVIVTALDDMEILTASQSQVRQWILQNPEINRTFLPYLGEQMHRLADQAEDLALYDTEARLARLILRHITSNAPVHGLRLINDLSQETLASMIGSVRVVVGRQMSKWKQEGILSTGRGKWAIDDLNELIAKAQKKLDI